MPTLLLLRHAKAEPANVGNDHERALTERGAREAAAMGRTVAERFSEPGVVLCSTSTRTRQTWDEVSKSLRGPEPTFLREIYEAGDDYLAILRRHGGSAGSILLIGHNPTMQATALGLLSSVDAGAGNTLAQKFPTAALAVLDLEGDWAKLQPGAARLREFITPSQARPD